MTGIATPTPAAKPAAETGAAAPAPGTAAAPAAPAAPPKDPKLSPIENATKNALAKIEEQKRLKNETPEQKAERESAAAATTAEETRRAALTDEQRAEEDRVAEERKNETPEQKAEREKVEREKDPLRVMLPGVRPEDGDLEVFAADEQTAEAMRRLRNGYMRGEEARIAQEEAQADRDRAEELHLEARLDPAASIIGLIQPRDGETPDQRAAREWDQDHLVRYLLTSDGVIQRTEKWLRAILDNQEAIPAERRVAESDRINRRADVEKEVAEERRLNGNARQLVRTIEKSINSMTPKEWTDQAKALFFRDIRADVIDFARVKQMQEVDPRVVPGLITRRLTALGIKPREATPPVKEGAEPSAAAAPKRTVAPAGRTPADLVAGRDKRAAAAAAPPGAGSPLAGIPTPPKYDPKQPGTPIEQRVSWWNSVKGALRKSPT